jgi:hypothetical protein
VLAKELTGPTSTLKMPTIRPFARRAADVPK